LLAAILMRFGLKPVVAPELAKAIKAADRDAAFYEATELAGFALSEARKFFRSPRVALSDFAPYLKPWRPEEAQARFLDRFAELDA
jgi:5'-deoxynucleotidase YfbR-like HD superfamily hydrolase